MFERPKSAYVGILRHHTNTSQEFREFSTAQQELENIISARNVEIEELKARIRELTVQKMRPQMPLNNVKLFTYMQNEQFDEQLAQVDKLKAQLMQLREMSTLQKRGAQELLHQQLKEQEDKFKQQIEQSVEQIQKLHAQIQQLKSSNSEKEEIIAKLREQLKRHQFSAIINTRQEKMRANEQQPAGVSGEQIEIPQLELQQLIEDDDKEEAAVGENQEDAAAGEDSEQ